MLSPIDHDRFGELLVGLPVEIHYPASRDQDAVVEVSRGAEIIVDDWSAQLIIPPAVVTGAGRLAFVQHCGAGMDRPDLRGLAAALAGMAIPLSNTPGTSAASIAEWCLGAAICLARLVMPADGWVRAGEWPQLRLAERGARELASQRVGILGLGAVGSRCAELFAAVGCDTAYWSRTRRPAGHPAPAIWRELDDLLATSDVLVITLASTAQTRGLLDASRIALLPRHALVVNPSRGSIIDEVALTRRLASGRLGGAALDVFATEPLPADSPLRELPNVILSPHSSGNTPQSRQRLLDAVRDNLTRVIRDGAVRWVTNGVDTRIRRRDTCPEEFR